eukprot:20767-Pelagococcus_subviridis.AAC.1
MRRLSLAPSVQALSLVLVLLLSALRPEGARAMEEVQTEDDFEAFLRAEADHELIVVCAIPRDRPGKSRALERRHCQIAEDTFAERCVGDPIDRSSVGARGESRATTARDRHRARRSKKPESNPTFLPPSLPSFLASTPPLPQGPRRRLRAVLRRVRARRRERAGVRRHRDALPHGKSRDRARRAPSGEEEKARRNEIEIEIEIQVRADEERARDARRGLDKDRQVDHDRGGRARAPAGGRDRAASGLEIVSAAERDG